LCRLHLYLSGLLLSWLQVFSNVQCIQWFFFPLLDIWGYNTNCSIKICLELWKFKIQRTFFLHSIGTVNFPPLHKNCWTKLTNFVGAIIDAQSIIIIWCSIYIDSTDVVEEVAPLLESSHSHIIMSMVTTDYYHTVWGQFVDIFSIRYCKIAGMTGYWTDNLRS